MKLIFDKFNVYMIYGFKVKSLEDEQFDKLMKRKKENKGFDVLLRNGWNTFYKMTSGINDVIQDIKISDAKIKALKVLTQDDSPKWNIINKDIECECERYLSIRRDGFGTITLAFIFNQDNVLYNVSDLIRVLLLAPRTMFYDKEEITLFDNDIRMPLPDFDGKVWATYSTAYKLFVSTLYYLNEYIVEIPKWQPKLNGESSCDFNNIADSLFNKKDGYTEEILKYNDSQIPYMYVSARMPRSLYNKSFLEVSSISSKNKKYEKKRAQYSKELAAILGRWLNSNNIKYASLEYWENQGLFNNSIFYNRFMNSLAYTIFSGMLTITISPNIKGDNKESRIELIPIEITNQTVLRYLEYARLRWHSFITINHELDIVINLIKLAKTKKDIIDCSKYIINIEANVSMIFQTPLHYLLDSSLGTSLNNYLNQDILNHIEDEIAKKIKILRDLRQDKWQYIEWSRIINADTNA